jgi:transaldolase
VDFSRLRDEGVVETVDFWIKLRGDAMKPTRTLHNFGQSLWLDNITRGLVNSGALRRYIGDFAVTGLTSNPTIFDQAIKNSFDYDDDISQRASCEKSPEDLFFDLALADLTQAADLFQPTFERTDSVDGWVSLEVSPLLAHDTGRTLAAARCLHRRAGRPNFFIKIPGTAEGLAAIEAAIFAGVPVNVTLLFSREQYVAAANAYMRGVERRIEAGLNPAVASVASVFISRWDVAVSGRVPSELTNRLGIAVAQRTYKAYLALLGSRRFQRAANAGARVQRLLWASTGTKDPKASDTIYVRSLAAPLTINTMPENTLKAFSEHGEINELLTLDGGDCEDVLTSFGKAGVAVDALAAQLQDDGAASFVKSWNDLMIRIESKSAAIRKAS